MIVKAWGDWTLFQALLVVLRSIADKYEGMNIANIATRWVLDHPFVGAVIVGTLPCVFRAATKALSFFFGRCSDGCLRTHRRQSEGLWVPTECGGQSSDRGGASAV